MSQAKLRSLQKHADSIRNRLSSGVIPERRTGQEVAYKAWLQSELARTLKTIETLQLTQTKK